MNLITCMQTNTRSTYRIFKRALFDHLLPLTRLTVSIPHGRYGLIFTGMLPIRETTNQLKLAIPPIAKNLYQTVLISLTAQERRNIKIFQFLIT